MNLILIRHGENEKTGTFDLTSRGKQFSNEIDLYLDSYKTRNIYVTGDHGEATLRCMETIRPYASGAKKEIKVMPLLDIIDDWRSDTTPGELYDVLIFRSIDFSVMTDDSRQYFFADLKPEDEKYHRIIALTGLLSKNPFKFRHRFILETGIASRNS